jgi:hypothetical protein
MLISNGNTTFNGGEMTFNFINGYQAVVGDSWNFLIAGNISGWNTLKFNVTGLGNGLGYQVEAITGGEELLITGASSTPIPGAIWLFGSGLLGLIGLKRKYLG